MQLLKSNDISIFFFFSFFYIYKKIVYFNNYPILKKEVVNTRINVPEGNDVVVWEHLLQLVFAG